MSGSSHRFFNGPTHCEDQPTQGRTFEDLGATADLIPCPRGCGDPLYGSIAGSVVELTLTPVIGAKASIVVPPPGVVSIESAPCTKRTRSRMLISPNPRGLFTLSISKPTPESDTRSLIPPGVPWRHTLKRRTPLCFIALRRASCNTRTKQTETSRGMVAGMFSFEK